MDILVKLYEFLFYRAEVPKLFGTFHIVSFILIAVATALAVKFLSNADDKTIRRFMLLVWISLVIGEIYREVAFSLRLIDGELKWEYAWYLFPFQMCSSPLYALPFVIFLPDGRLRDGFCSYLSMFSLFGGLSVMIYAGDVFTGIVGSNVQSMFHHGMQVLIGVVLAIHNRKKLSKRYFLDGILTFAGFFCLAMLLNVAGYHLLRANSRLDTFNMFYISPYFDCSLPILSTIQKATSYWVILPLYFFVFIFIAAVLFSAQKFLIDKYCKSEER